MRASDLFMYVQFKSILKKAQSYTIINLKWK